MRASLTRAVMVALLLAGGCDKLSIINRTPSGPGSAPGAVAGSAGSGGAGGAGQAGSGGQGGASVGLPCDVQAILVKYCDSCHGEILASGAPRSLVSYAELTKPDLMTSGITEAQAALQRIQNKSSPMPPAPASGPTTTEIATLQAWIGNGYPSGTCGVSASGGSGGTTQAGGGGAGGGSGSGGSSQAGSGGSGGGADAGPPAAGLPCAVQTLLVNRCDSCHGATPSGGAPRSLVSYADLTSSDPANTSMTEAQVALVRMQSTTSPMPPSPASPATAAEIAALQSWVNSGYPASSCGVAGSGGGGGTTQTGGGGTSGAGGSSQAGSGGSGGADAGVPGGTLPCDVQTLLVNRCDSCHGTTPSGGAPRSLVSYANLTSSDPANPGMTEAQVALQRMQSTTSPMPPSPASVATSAEIATLQSWINNGYPSGSCGGDAGAPPPDPLNNPPTCTSKTTWTSGTNGSASMEPGQACISCHAKSGGEAPTFVIAGTLYPTGHEPDNCNGVNGSTGARVVVTGNNGTSITLTPNSAGNFYSSTSLPPPYQAKVVNGSGVERVMSSTASTGDCNSCHTQSGASGAPGRITLP